MINVIAFRTYKFITTQILFFGAQKKYLMICKIAIFVW